jgi:hypothetical protein
MRNPKAPGVQAEALGGVGFGAVFRITDDRTAGIGEVNADLMAAASLKGQLNKGAALVSLQDTIMSDGVPSGLGAGNAEDFKGTGFVEPGLEGAFVVRQHAFNHGLVTLFRLVPSFLQSGLGAGSLGENNDPAGFAVEPMHNPDAFLGVGIHLSQIIGKLEIGGLFLLCLAGDGEEVRGLVDDDEGGVFEVNLDPAGDDAIGRRVSIRTDRDGIARFQRMVELGDDAAIDEDGLMFQPGADLLLLRRGPVGEEVRQKFRGLTDGARFIHRESVQPLRWRTEGPVVEKEQRGWWRVNLSGRRLPEKAKARLPL